MNTLIYKLDNQNEIPELNLEINNAENTNLPLSELIPELESKILDIFNRSSDHIKTLKLEVDFV